MEALSAAAIDGLDGLALVLAELLGAGHRAGGHSAGLLGLPPF